MKSKTIIISSQDENSNGRGILTIYQEDDLLKCKLRLYNFPKLNRNCKLGIYHNEEVFSANLIDRGGFYESSFVGDFDMNKDFYTALIDVDKNNNVLLAGGTYAGYYFDDTSVFSESISTINTSDEADLNIKDSQDEECDKCARCKYKEYFYNEPSKEFISTKSTQEEDETTPAPTDSPDSTEEPREIKESPSIIKSILPQFNYIFENYPADEELNRLIEHGKFVKINENAEQYSIGAIYQDDSIKYICYAVKCNYNTPAPEELGKYYQWVPIDNEDPLSEGYYIVYQDAEDLKIIRV